MTEQKEKAYSVSAALKEKKKVEFRLTPDGEVIEGFWKNKGKLIPTGAGFKFTLRRVKGIPFIKPNGQQEFKEDSRGEERYLIKNHDYGWQKATPVQDESGEVYDTVISNAQGFDFENFPYQNPESAIEAAKSWLSERERQRSMYEEE